MKRLQRNGLKVAFGRTAVGVLALQAYTRIKRRETPLPTVTASLESDLVNVPERSYNLHDYIFQEGIDNQH